MKSVGIIGLGLMGGSFAKALRAAYKEIDIFGFDQNKLNEKEAISLNIVDKVVSFDEILICDLIVLAVPVKAIIDITQSIKKLLPNQTIIDFGSTKEKIVKAIPDNIRENFVALHPMAGTEKSGPKAAIDDLYRGKIVVLCDIEDSGSYQKDLVEKLFKKIGMNIVYMDSHSHDRDAAYISHMPHALSFALANVVLKHEDPKSILALSAGGFKSMSRIAKSSPNMWSDIFEQNSDNLIESIEKFEDELSRLKNLVKDKHFDEVKEFIKEANNLHKLI